MTTSQLVADAAKQCRVYRMGRTDFKPSIDKRFKHDLAGAFYQAGIVL